MPDGHSIHISCDSLYERNIDYMGNILLLYFKNGQFCLKTDFILCKKEQRVDNHRYTNKCCFVV